MRSIKSIFSLLITITVFLSACRRGDLVERPGFIKFSLDVFITDTAVYNTVRLHNTGYDITLSAKEQIINGTYANIVNESQGIKKPPTDKVRLNVTVVKVNSPNLLYNELITTDNVNDFLLLQIDPKQAPVLINKLTEADKYDPPGTGSIKARFFFNDADGMVNINNNNSKVTVVDIQLFKAEQNINGNYIVEKDALLKGIKINELSDYFSFQENTLYGFDLLDADAALPNNKRRIQKYDFDQYDHFLKGRINLVQSATGRFQTIRLQKEFRSSGSYIGEYLFSFK